jgi:mannose-6-phosphate isomerase-like protein (cupin superfamily)
MEPLVVDIESQPVVEIDRGSRARVIAAQSNGTTCMAVVERWLDPGVGTSLHSHPEGTEEVVWVKGGRAHFRVGDEEATVEVDNTVVIPAGTLHAFTSAGDETLHLMCRYSSARPLVLDANGVPGAPEIPGT